MLVQVKLDLNLLSVYPSSEFDNLMFGFVLFDQLFVLPAVDL